MGLTGGGVIPTRAVILPAVEAPGPPPPGRAALPCPADRPDPSVRRRAPSLRGRLLTILLFFLTFCGALVAAAVNSDAARPTEGPAAKASAEAEVPGSPIGQPGGAWEAAGSPGAGERHGHAATPHRPPDPYPAPLPDPNVPTVLDSPSIAEQVTVTPPATVVEAEPPTVVVAPETHAPASSVVDRAPTRPETAGGSASDVPEAPGVGGEIGGSVPADDAAELAVADLSVPADPTAAALLDTGGTPGVGPEVTGPSVESPAETPLVAATGSTGTLDGSPDGAPTAAPQTLGAAMEAWLARATAKSVDVAESPGPYTHPTTRTRAARHVTEYVDVPGDFALSAFHPAGAPDNPARDREPLPRPPPTPEPMPAPPPTVPVPQHAPSSGSGGGNADHSGSAGDYTAAVLGDDGTWGLTARQLRYAAGVRLRTHGQPDVPGARPD